MVLHPFDIPCNILGGNPEEQEKIRQDPMATSDGTGNAFPLGRQGKSPVFFMPNQPFPVQSLNHLCDACLRNPKTAGNIDHSGIPLFVDQLLNAFQVILHSGRGFGVLPVGSFFQRRDFSFGLRGER